MVTIRFCLKETGQVMTLTGHAGAGAFGKDLVCAAASTLAYTGAQSLLQLHREGILKQTPRILLSPGSACLEIFENCPEAETVLFTLRTGCSLLAGKYPNYIRLELVGEREK